MKLVINSCFGGFFPSEKWLKKLGKTLSEMDSIRYEPEYIKAVEDEEDDTTDHGMKHKVVEVPDGLTFNIQEYDGIEYVTTHFQVKPEDLLVGLTPEQLCLASKADYIYILGREDEA